MNMSTNLATAPRLMLCGDTAEELMTPNPISISETATVKEAAAFLVDHGFSAAPVVDHAGRAVGVLSQTDIVTYDRNMVQHLRPVPEFYHKSDLTLHSGEVLAEGFEIESVDTTQVRDIMTPAVISVMPSDTAVRVVGEMVAFKVHRLFVIDESGVLVGVISAFDVLRKLHTE